MPELLEASAGYQIEFQVQVVLNDAPDEVRAKVGQLIDARLKPGPPGREDGSSGGFHA